MNESRQEKLTEQFPRFFELKREVEWLLQDHLPPPSGMNRMVIDGIRSLWVNNSNNFYSLFWLSMLDLVPTAESYRTFATHALDCIERVKWITCQSYDDTVFPVNGNNLSSIKPGYRLMLADGLYTSLLESLSAHFSQNSIKEPGALLWSELIEQECIFSDNILKHDEMTLREKNIWYHLDMLSLLRTMITKISKRGNGNITWSLKMIDSFISFWKESLEGAELSALVVEPDNNELSEGQKEWERTIVNYFNAIVSAGFLTFSEQS